MPAKPSSFTVKLRLTRAEFSFVQDLAQRLSTDLRPATNQDAVRHVLHELHRKISAETEPLPLEQTSGSATQRRDSPQK